MERVSSVFNSDRSNKFRCLSTELWIEIACYFDNLKDFFRAWLAGNLIRLIPKSHPSFWKILLKLYLQSRSIPFEQATRSSYMQPNETSYYDFALIQSLFTARKCTRSGCFQKYCEWSNHPKACAYHSGKYKPGQYVSCCRAKSFQEPGCKFAYHSGMFHFMVNIKREDPPKKEENEKSKGTSASLPSISSSPANRQTSGNSSSMSLLKLPPIS